MNGKCTAFMSVLEYNLIGKNIPNHLIKCSNSHPPHSVSLKYVTP